jgi:bifunctional non-homologous end joining protein LigD
MLVKPMLSRVGPLPSGAGWSFEVKWDGFRAIVSTVDGLAVHSRRGWNMTGRVPELQELPPGLVLDGELVAFREGNPWFPDLCARILHGHHYIPVVFVVFDLLRQDGDSLLQRPYRERRQLLEDLNLHNSVCHTSPTFDDGPALMKTVIAKGWEGVMAKRVMSTYGPRRRGWVKTKNTAYWRHEQERQLARSFRRPDPFAAEAF